jgi:hypothetical protein
MKAAQKRYYNKKRENEEFQERRRAYSKKHYDNNKEKVINRVQNYQRKVLELEQLERLYELQQQGLINYDTGKINDEQYEKYNKKLFDKLAHLHLSS